MDLLLDTHVWIWTQEQPERLSATLRARLLDPASRLWVSPVSTLELARLVDGGLVTLDMDLLAWTRESRGSLRADLAPLTDEVAVEAYALPAPFHRDPVDRMLVATARVMEATLVTADAAILNYPHVRTLKAHRR